MSFALRTVLERLMSIADIIEEVDLILAGEEGSSDAVNRRIVPALRAETPNQP